MRSTRPSAITASTATQSVPPPASGSTKPSEPMRWSDVAVGRRSTHPDAAPVKRTLDTPELLENVLKYLPPKDLVLMQRLCRAVHATTQSSRALQAALLRKPIRDSDQQPWVYLSTDTMLTGIPAANHITNLKSSGPAPRVVQPHVYNPLLVEPWKLPSLKTFALDSAVGTLRLNTNNKIDSLTAKASFRDMFLTQPPVTEVVIVIHGKCYYPSWEDRRGLPKWFSETVATPKIANVEGVTFGELVDAIRSEERRASGAFVISQEFKDMAEKADTAA
ncbi:hypothetical protein LTR37_015684 [Vermiconidia calcicola]|uniref:Uncharacterized protein n=1 Tax=Vermiconidia calcicola TaxID=1690605 RepID=A0ACC3MQS4_9PEZI|nr:hypothetical protein LTR37_015684 [Vermiconidia calcicola]